jgi:hypothetical protein
MITPKELNRLTSAQLAVPGPGHSAPQAPSWRPGRHRTDGAEEPTNNRARALLDRRGLCRNGVGPGSWFVARPDRTLLEREAAQVRSRVLCAGCPVLLLCRRTVLPTVSRPGPPVNGLVPGGGVWGGLAWWEVRTAVRRNRKARAYARRPGGRRWRAEPVPARSVGRSVAA